MEASSLATQGVLLGCQIKYDASEIELFCLSHDLPGEINGRWCSYRWIYDSAQIIRQEALELIYLIIIITVTLQLGQRKYT